MWAMIIIITTAHKTRVELPVINKFSFVPPVQTSAWLSALFPGRA